MVQSVFGETRIGCPVSYPCSCRPIKLYPGRRAVLENIVDCSNRKLTDLPDLKRLSGYPLSKIVLQNNHIQHIKTGSFEGINMTNTNQLSDIPTIDLSSNPLKILQASTFRGLYAVELELRLNNCSLLDLPMLDPQTASVIVGLYLTYNDVKVIPNGIFLNYSKLMLLDLSGIWKPKIHSGCFVGLEHTLTCLYMEDMGLTQVPAAQLLRLKTLQLLFLGRNHIVQLPEYVFNGLESSLMMLTFSKNKLHYISPEAFHRHNSSNVTYSIHELYLDDNYLTSLDFLSEPCSLVLHNTSKVSVRENPIHCDCHLYNITHYKVVDILGTCYSPTDYVGQSLDWKTYIPHDSTFGHSFPVSGHDECSSNSSGRAMDQHFDCYCGELRAFSDTVNTCPSAISCGGNLEYPVVALSLLMALTIPQG